MSRIPLPLYVGDISHFAKTLRQQMTDLESKPSHVEMLNLLCKASGFRNFQHFRAQQPDDAPARPQPPEINHKRVKETVRHFDTGGRLIRWPKKDSIRILSLWVMWSRIPARTGLSEPEINALLDGQHHFEDYALLRRELCDRGMVERTADGRRYTRREVQPPRDGVAIIQRVKSAVGAA